jgi:hypothetical protein
MANQLKLVTVLSQAAIHRRGVEWNAAQAGDTT